jgi:hypothetical protein
MAVQYDPSNTNGQQQLGGPATEPPGYFKPPKPKRDWSTNLIATGIVLAVFAGLFVFFWLRDSSPAAHIGGLDVRALHLGDCFNEPSATEPGTVQKMESVPCTEPHDAQVIGLPMLNAGIYDDAAIKSEADQECKKTASSILIDQTKLGDNASVIEFTPTPNSWAKGDRDFTCAVDNGPGNKLTGSVMK